MYILENLGKLKKNFPRFDSMVWLSINRMLDFWLKKADMQQAIKVYWVAQKTIYQHLVIIYDGK